MRIAVNTRFLRETFHGGIGKFTHETFRRLTVQHPEHHFYFLFDRKYSANFIYSTNVTPLIVGQPARHPFFWYAWYEWAIPPVLKNIKADLFISPDGFLSLSTRTPSIAVIHDLNFEYYPHFVPFFERLYYRHYFPKFAKKAKRIITVSEFSRQDIAKQYKINSNKIDVAYNGSSKEYKPLDESERFQVRQQFSDGNEYFIFVGGLYPRKNIRNLLLAFDEFKRKTHSDFRLIIVGPKIWWSSDWEYVYKRMEFAKHVLFFNALNFTDLTRLVGAAFALVFPSWFEGFGIPIVEAMSCQVPVITSLTSSMPEVAGDAALYVNPSLVDSISKAMIKIIEDNNLRDKIIENGKVQILKFSWDKTAEDVWKSVEKVMN
ncbi:MAG: glycosyltransferase family 4 protein [Bacteroidetes bacterium]|nr:glycosyltransferase family 4 protein [Bacteroidota bacterium]